MAVKKENEMVPHTRAIWEWFDECAVWNYRMCCFLWNWAWSLEQRI